ncbi:hypothetical protein BC628DRAFT_1371861 [Trametes gibbosa]|nr:hypothetical protein BC628DRAFT_1371861 [Trametes gibbosa]
MSHRAAFGDRPFCCVFLPQHTPRRAVRSAHWERSALQERGLRSAICSSRGLFLQFARRPSTFARHCPLRLHQVRGVTRSQLIRRAATRLFLILHDVGKTVRISPHWTFLILRTPGQLRACMRAIPEHGGCVCRPPWQAKIARTCTLFSLASSSNSTRHECIHVVSTEGQMHLRAVFCA